MTEPTTTLSEIARRLAILLLLLPLVAACAAPAPLATPPAATPTKAPVAKITFMAGFKPQANLPFVAAYVAQEKGYFAQQGLEVEIKHSSGGGEEARLLAAGQVQFVTSPAEDVIKRNADPGLPFVAIALFGQQGDRGWAVLKDSGINSPKDWEGKTVGYKVFPPPDYLAILKANGVNRSKIKEVNVGFDPRILVEKKVDVYQVFVSNEPDTIERMGYRVKVFQASDYGVPTLGVTYVTTRDYISENPGVVERFLKATMKGFAFAMDNPQETLDIVMKYAPNEERKHQEFMLAVESKAAVSELTRANGLGWMTSEQWNALYKSLQDFGAIEKPVDIKLLYTDQFLKRIYENGKLQWP